VCGTPSCSSAAETSSATSMGSVIEWLQQAPG
jgi:hypothetical protein